MAGCGLAVLCTGAVALALLPMLPVDARMPTVLVARAVVAGGLALAVAGVLCAELLRRSVAPASAAAVVRRADRVEVTHPPELRTYVGGSAFHRQFREARR